MDATLKAAQDRFDGWLLTIATDIKATLAGRKPRDLTGADAVQFIALKAELDSAATEQKHFAEADLAARLTPVRATNRLIIDSRAKDSGSTEI
jgi:hypothetical protein